MQPPDKDARKHIFQIHTKKKPLESDVNLDNLVEMTEGMTGADIPHSKRSCNECNKGARQTKKWK